MKCPRPIIIGTHSRRVSACALSTLAACAALACSRGKNTAEPDTQPQREPSQTTLGAPQPPGPPPRALDVGGDALTQVAERTLPSVVSVASTRVARVEAPGQPLDNPLFRHFFGPDAPSPSPFPGAPGNAPEQHGLGSGVIVAPNVILTNAHVVEGADKLEVLVKGKRSLNAQVVGSDPKSDLAVLRVSGDTSGLRPIEFADSSQVRLGEIVLAVGNPFGIGQTVTMGIVSGVGRANLGIVDYEDFIQTDAAINPGNSGGALVDTDGKLVGIPTAILSRSGGYMGVGFAIPSNMAKPIMNSLLQSGRVARGYIGVSIQDIDQELANALALPSTDGVLIADVAGGGPAAKAGLQRGDIVVSIDGKAVNTTGELRNIVASTSAGKTVRVEVLRGKEKRAFEVRVGELPTAPAEAKAAPEQSQGTSAGLTLAPLDASMRSRLDVPSSIQKGAVVTAVQPGSPAARAGIRPGDVIIELDKKPVDSPARFAELWKSVRLPTAILVVRDGRSAYVPINR